MAESETANCVTFQDKDPRLLPTNCHTAVAKATALPKFPAVALPIGSGADNLNISVFATRAASKESTVMVQHCVSVLIAKRIQNNKDITCCKIITVSQSKLLA